MKNENDLSKTDFELDQEKQVSKYDNKYEWCVTSIADKPVQAGADRAGLLKEFKWVPDSKITISFLDGDEELRERVKKSALKWIAPGMAALRFVFVDNGTTDTNIRISFSYAGSWSVLGTSCKNITDITQPTMNFGWLNKDSTDEELERVVLHEFGHALGLIHEHMSPIGGIKWNRAQVIKDLSSPPNAWSLSVIENNMFKKFDPKDLELTELDQDSIMMYPIPAKWTTDGFNVGLNSKISAVDKKFIKMAYPGNDTI